MKKFLLIFITLILGFFILPAQDVQLNTGTPTSNPEANIGISYPYLGANHYAGVSITIIWDCPNYSGNIKIEYSVDGGAWTTITDSTENDGYHYWQIPRTLTGSGRFRVSTTDGSSSGTSSSFNILPALNITLLTPNGGESLQSRTYVDITWTDLEPLSWDVLLEYSTDSGQTWQSITRATNDGHYSWQVPAHHSDLCQVRAIAVDDAAVDTSDAVFSIHDPLTTIPDIEREALIALYNAANGDSWTNNGNWKKEDGTFHDKYTARLWYGVTVTNGHVTGLDLNTNQLTGTIPPEIGNLMGLEELRLYSNQLTGPIPPGIGNLMVLKELILHSNQLTGPIPPEIGSLLGLRKLELYSNQFTGTIPPEIGNLTALNWLNLSNNQLSGAIPLELGNLSNLWYVYLSYNQLSGTIPAELFALTDLADIGLISNHLSGNIPHFKSTGALSIGLAENKLSGPVGDWVLDLASFTNLLIDYNATYTDNPDVALRLGSTWEISQTNAPEDVTVTPTASSIRLDWTPIQLDFSTVSYNIYYSETPGGPYHLHTTVAGRASSSVTITDVPCGYFTVTSETATHNHNRNIVESDYSQEVYAVRTGIPLTVLSPNGGDTLQPDATQAITWAHPGYGGNIKIEYSYGEPRNWVTITDSTENDGVYWWQVCDTPYDSCSIRISEVNGAASASSGYFEIVPVSNVTVLSPNGGERLRAGETHEITWTHPGYGSNVHIQYCHTPDEVYTTIVASTENDGSHTWLVPETVSDSCKIRISGGSETDDSDNSFEILPAYKLTLTAPNGGELLETDTYYDITWTDIGLDNATVNITYSTDSGQTWSSVGLTSNSGSYSWYVPSTPSAYCLIRISAFNGNITDTSEAAFSICTKGLVIPETERDALIALYNATNGDTWTFNFNWKKADGTFTGRADAYMWHGVTVEDGHVTQLNLPFNKLSGPLVPEIANLTGLTALDLEANQLSGPIPSEFGNMGKLRVLNLRFTQLSGAIPPGLGNLSSLEELHLEVNQLSGFIPPELGNLPKLKVLNLSWNQLAGTVPPLKNPNLLHASVASNKLSGPIGDWLLDLPLDSFGIRCNALYTNNPDVARKLDDLTNSQTTAPEGVTVTPAASSIRLDWTPIQMDYGTGSYNIYYSETPGGPYTLHTTAEGRSTSTVTITDVPYGYFVVTSETSAHDENANIVESDYSEEVYAIRPGTTLSVASPNGGEVLQAGATHPITWTASNIAGTVDISYSTAGIDGTFLPITTVAATAGTYSWQVPDVDSVSCYIRISDTASPLTDFGDAAFTIQSIPSISITSPTAGLNWQPDGSAQVNWTVVNLTGDVTVELYKGSTLSAAMGTVSAVTGSLTWQVPSDITVGDNYRVRVSRGAVEDYSANFSISGGRYHYFQRCDFNGDGAVDIAFYRPSNSRWYIKGQPSIAWGAVGDIPVPGDYDGDGTTDIAIYRPSTGRWCIMGQPSIAYGTATDIPIPGDYDGDGTTDIAIFRPSNGRWCIMGQPSIAYGTATDIPIPGDYDGDGSTDIAIFRPSNGRWCIMGQPSQAYGISTDLPIPADYDGNGTTDIAVFRPSTARWCVMGQPSVAWGTSTDIPIPGDFDGDGDADITIFRPSTGAWATKGVPSVRYGASTDVPLISHKGK
ncbi:MAG: hypothetical protein GY765_20545 [bacterium]|nr:hypothetical protein [bacterium]